MHKDEIDCGNALRESFDRFLLEELDNILSTPDTWTYFLPPCFCDSPETEYEICKECLGIPVETDHLKFAFPPKD